MTEGHRLFCSKPFTWFEVPRARQNEVFLCCRNWLDTPAGNLADQSVDEIWNGPVARDINLSCPTGRSELMMETDRGEQILAIQRKLSEEAVGRPGSSRRAVHSNGSGSTPAS